MISVASGTASRQPGAPPARCPICGATGRHRRPTGTECDHCGLVLTADGARADGPAEDVRAGDVRDEVRGWLLGGAAGAGWRLDGHAVRNAAWALGLVAADGGWADARPCPHDVTLAVMARAGEVAAVAAMVAALAFPRAVVLFDAPVATAPALAAACRHARVAAHPLAGDFAAQRNRLQAMAPPGWVLHLDSDETPGGRLVAALGWLTAAADRDGLLALGLPRRNLVDGTLSALYPDIQYRLVRERVRFAGRVHERPDVAFAQTSLALAGALDHRLSGARVRERTRIYGAMAADGARAEDEAALLAPYRGPPQAVA